MSEENVEIVRSIYEAFRRLDSSTLADEDIYTRSPTTAGISAGSSVPL